MSAAGSERSRARGTGGWWMVFILFIGVAGVLVFQRSEAETLRKEIDASHVRRDQAARLRAENQSLAAEYPSNAELALLRDDREVLAGLRSEVEKLRNSAGKTRRVAGASIGSKPAMTIVDGLVPESAWRNVGHETPEAAVETALWAAAGGDVELLARSLFMDTAAREQAAALLAGLPSETRAFYGTPELLMAFLTAKDIPSEGARILKPGPDAQAAGRRTVQLRDAARRLRQTHLTLKETPEGWRLVVPAEAVTRYRTMLKGTPANSPTL